MLDLYHESPCLVFSDHMTNFPFEPLAVLNVEHWLSLCLIFTLFCRQISCFLFAVFTQDTNSLIERFCLFLFFLSLYCSVLEQFCSTNENCELSFESFREKLWLIGCCATGCMCTLWILYVPVCYFTYFYTQSQILRL